MRLNSSCSNEGLTIVEVLLSVVLFTFAVVIFSSALVQDKQLVVDGAERSQAHRSSVGQLDMARNLRSELSKPDWQAFQAAAKIGVCIDEVNLAYYNSTDSRCRTRIRGTRAAVRLQLVDDANYLFKSEVFWEGGSSQANPREYDLSGAGTLDKAEFVSFQAVIK